MTRQYSDNPYESPRYRGTLRSHQPSDSSFRRHISLVSRNLASQPNFQPNGQKNHTISSPRPPRYHGEHSHFNKYPNSTRSSFNQMNNASNDRSHRRYRIEAHSPHSLSLLACSLLAVPAGSAVSERIFRSIVDLFAHDQPNSIGLSESNIERLPTMPYRKTSKSPYADDRYAICLTEYKTDEIVKRLRCKHFFHPECIGPWLKTSTQCPICRAVQAD
ncbi:unnamed protein product [Rotaria sp. Silwood1]|nr:unnamed protein product [Rotaria sp. Silwood1]CAF1669032.1 unnamed protein product [Rotaria sp. Silwood1]